MAISARLTESEKKILLKIQDSISIMSHHQFLLEQNGWRDGKIHLVVGPTGAGKSTWVRTMLVDFLLSNPEHQAMLVLSEETSDDFKTDFNRLNFKNDEPDRVFVVSEQDNNFKTFSEYGKYIELHIQELGIDFLIVDNLTTSQFYAEKKSDQQIIISKFWKSLSQKMQIPIVLIAHTSAEVTENYKSLIVPEHIRGSKNIVNLSEFIYVLQPINIGETKLLFMRVCKSRGQDVQNKIYSLHWHQAKRLYGKVESRSFKEFHEDFKMRNKL
jgi:KaiC/GvpD/RAD55 family RecA-like ATPase